MDMFSAWACACHGLGQTFFTCLSYIVLRGHSRAWCSGSYDHKSASTGCVGGEACSEEWRAGALKENQLVAVIDIV